MLNTIIVVAVYAIIYAAIYLLFEWITRAMSEYRNNKFNNKED